MAILKIYSRVLVSSVRRYAQNTQKPMQAWSALDYGSPDILQFTTSLGPPVIKRPTDVVVEVNAASVNPLDVMMLNGYGSSIIGAMQNMDQCSLKTTTFPLVLGRDFSGTIVSTGGCVKKFKAGDEVFGVVGPQQQGSHATYVKTSSFCIAKKPSTLNHAESASFPYSALTSFSALSTFGDLSPTNAYGKRVLVLGASGGVGTVSVQLLRTWGADITATCATDAMEMVLNLGASTVIDYLSPDYLRELKQLPRFDFILDTVGEKNQSLVLDLLKSWSNSKYVTVVSPLLQNADQHGLVLGNIKSAVEAAVDTARGLKNGQSVRWAYFVPNGQALKTISQMIENKQIVPVIDTVFNFEDVPNAYRKVLVGHARGKTVIDFRESITQEEKVADDDVKHQ